MDNLNFTSNDRLPDAFDAPAIPVCMPRIDVGESDKRSFTEQEREKSGNDLARLAVLSLVIGCFLPFGFVLVLLSMFFLFRIFAANLRPSPVYMVLTIVLGLWHLWGLVNFAAVLLSQALPIQ
ncbi:hypothetical protein [Lignipirellula cremea]|uniref:Uncharacterized protein n=1 Tax=Lignipirellula cremea TaxID=2528010 RepID=A0A518E0R4_9BACT|nr:hypothetical protein [Lignipirellula cremea]QDU97667.1 hypothetical protein Pla8534_55190 [Lignipirellula cremea]